MKELIPSHSCRSNFRGMIICCTGVKTLASQVAEFGIRASEDFPKWVCCGGQTSGRPNLKTVTVFKFRTGGLMTSVQHGCKPWTTICLSTVRSQNNRDTFIFHLAH